MKKILIVEDDSLLLEVYQKSIQAEGYKVDTAKDYKETLEKFAPSKYGLIILDIMLNGKNGFELLKALRRQRGGNKVKIAIVTGMNTDDLKLNKELLVGLNIIGIYTKSQFSIGQLLAVVKYYMGKDESE